MKKVMSLLVAGAMFTGTACTSTSTDSTANSTAETATSTNATGGGTTSTTMGTTTTGTAAGTTAGGSTAAMGTTAGGTTTGGGTTGGGTTGGTAGAAGGGTAGATADMTNMTDAMFMMTSASSNMLEIQAGELAVQNAMNAEVKKFAQMMIDHHTKASQEQMSLASQMNITLPTTLMPIHQTMMDKLRAKTGKDFDEEYMDMMETAHKMDIAMFTAKSANADTPTVKAFAAKTLPMLKSHQTQATKIEDQVD